MQVYVSVVFLFVLAVKTMPVQTLPNTDESTHITDEANVEITSERFAQKRGFQYETKGQGEFPGQRTKRSPLSLLAQKGLTTLKLLLKGTFQIPSKKYNVREFEKLGTLKTALKDFRDADPSFVQKIKFPSGITGRAGYIGDRSIILKARGEKGRPSIEVIKTHKTGDEIDPLIDVITYVKEIKL